MDTIFPNHSTVFPKAANQQQLVTGVLRFIIQFCRKLSCHVGTQQ